LKFWACLKLIGLEGYAQTIDHCMDMTYKLRSFLKKHADIEIMSTPEVSILCFRYNPSEIQRLDIAQVEKEDLLNHVNLALQKRLEAEGKAFLSVATYKGKKVLRAVILNYCTQEEDLRFIVREVLRIGKEVFLDKTTSIQKTKREVIT
jgi:glutamate decarboxylase